MREHGMFVEAVLEINFRPDVELELHRIATATGRVAEEVVQELVANAVDHDAWFREQVAEGIACLDRGDFVEHEDVVHSLERLSG